MCAAEKERKCNKETVELEKLITIEAPSNATRKRKKFPSHNAAVESSEKVANLITITMRPSEFRDHFGLGRCKKMFGLQISADGMGNARYEKMDTRPRNRFYTKYLYYTILSS